MRHVKVCTRCGSINIGIRKRGLDMLDMQSLCKDCGYVGVFPEVEIEQVEEFRKQIKEGSGGMREPEKG